MFLFREAGRDDEDAVFELARHLDSLNLPPERDFIHGLIRQSIRSFDGEADFDPARVFLFVLEDPDGRVVGTSMIHAQHGTPAAPHVYFTVSTEERHALLGPLADGSEKNVHMEHTMLQLSQTYKGPTELGGLVLHPDVRGHPRKLGRLLSLARFVFIAGFREWIRDRLLAELLPPLHTGPGGRTRSPLWDALGHRFTGLAYAEADRLSRIDKRFIWDLFPRMPVHASLLPEGVQDIVGQVGPGTVGALRLLESVGFRYVHRVDPFDGGPHVEADTDEVTLVRDTRPYIPDPGEPNETGLPGIVGVRSVRAPHFCAVWAHVEGVGHEQEEHDDATRVRMSRAALERLGVLAKDQPVVDPETRVLVALRPKRRRADLAADIGPG